MPSSSEGSHKPGPNSKPSLFHRQSSRLHYYTFPTAPPANPGRPQQQQQQQQRGSYEGAHGAAGDGSMGKPNGGPAERPQSSVEQSDGRSHSRGSGRHHEETPLPKGQLAILAVIALAEQTALNSISPYLPDMASSFPDVDDGQVGMYVGLIASAFALAQFTTNFAWGWLSDRVGRKPIVLTGTMLTAACFVAFGFCRTLWQAVLVQLLMGLVNGNQGVISTCLGEITDRSNQSRAFTYLPVLYGLGGITGPIVGGLLVFRQNPLNPSTPNPYPYLLPNLFSAGVLVIDFVLTAIFLEESLESAQDLPPLGKRVTNLFAWLWQFGSSHRPTYLRRYKKSAHEHNPLSPATERSALLVHDEDDEEEEQDDDGDDGSFHLLPNGDDIGQLNRREVFTRDTILLLVTFLIFQLANISYNSLYPIFAQASPPTGRSLSPEEIGLSLAFAGVITILFQVGIFGKLREKIGNKVAYRVGLAGFVVAFLLMPWIGYKDGTQLRGPGTGQETTKGKILLWIELGVVLIIKTVASVVGLTSALLLITNSAPSHAVLGTLNGLAQTLSAAGRAVGPFISGSLFSAAVNVKPKGEALAFGIFAAISFVGFLMSFGIRGATLEAEGWDEQSGDEEEGEDDETETEASPDGRR
ncbi:putative membrane protein [Teratosphaeria destructans]|uniref:Membrane protein n=1 Tax=Teratosphaeria destructans TaxID=418781 RepID=A0A9W7W368_9PEZI|nr:putative membrane protein [Teratosphaeria destructans]